MKREPLCIVGAGGFGREVLLAYAAQIERPLWKWKGQVYPHAFFAVSDEFYDPSDNIRTVDGALIRVKCIDSIKPMVSNIIAIGDPALRIKIDEGHSDIYHEAAFVKHPNADVGAGNNIGVGSVVCSGAVLTTNITIGRCAHLNLNCTIGHDCSIGNYFTAAPGAKLSGNVTIGDRVYIGTNASIKEGIEICDDVTIGMNAAVVKDITEPGVYAGVPARLIRHFR